MLIDGEDDGVPAVPGDEGADTNGAAGEGQVAETDTEGNEGTEPREPEPKDAHGWRQRIDKLTKQRTEVRQERDTLKAKIEELQGTVGDETVMAAAQASGVLPKFIDKAGAQVLTQAARLERDLSFFENHIGGEDYTFQVGDQTYTGRQAAQFAATVRSQLRQVAGKAEAIKQKAFDRHNSLLTLGEAAEKAGWKPGAKAAVPPATGARRTPGAPPPLPGEGGGERRAPARETAVPTIDYSKINTREDRLRALTLQARRDLE